MKCKDFQILDQFLENYQKNSTNLISILQEAQGLYGYLPLELLDYIAQKTHIKASKVHGVATFYTQFRLHPIGKYLIMLCQGTACHVNGAKLIEEAVCDELGIVEGQTTEDGLFTLNNVACLGCCSLSPVMMINDTTYGKLTPEEAKKIIKEIKEKERKEV
ncbi:NADH-quinone oxidoreductase subunit NuoE [Inediibacterium massiliense]|uniref:NADH-quinone oxidoreductase subunit NuoE n=1 Tax=Inediibacterium massiliense TaxID=1658111 RepID=UPI0006B58971|nr:NADH-quinone oxidoreductase subunit NuoE [Inediibacterium massiliense]